MQIYRNHFVLKALLLSAALISAHSLPAQTLAVADSSSMTAAIDMPDAPAAATSQQNGSPAPASLSPSPDGGKQTKRILGIMPNFRSVSVDAKLPPLSTKDKFVLMLQDSFDYSSFIYVGIIAGVGQMEKSYPEFHQGAAGYGRYYWHSFADNINGNLFTEALVPSVTREDPRYYTLGRGGAVKRTAYSVSRLLITRTDAGNKTFNFGEIVGNGAASGVSDLYYPRNERTWTKTGQKWLVQVSLDGVSNVVKEFWPDINKNIFHGKD